VILPSFTTRYRLCQYSLNWPPGLNTFAQITCINSCYLRPLGNTHSLPLEGYFGIRATVVPLLLYRSPSAIIWFIITVIIDTIQRVRWVRSWAHILIKSLKRHRPSFTYPDTPAAIMVVVLIILFCASMNHGVPGFVFWRPPHAVNPVAYPTATIPGATACKAVITNLLFITAIATTKPHGIIMLVFAYITQDSKATKSLAGQIFYAFIGNGYNLPSHFRTSNAIVMRGLLGVSRTLQSLLFYHTGTSVQLVTP